MILLDTDHLTALRYPELSSHAGLVRRMQESNDQHFAIPVVAVEEQLRGWLAVIRRGNNQRQLIDGYERLAALFEFFAHWRIIRFDSAAAEIFQQLRQKRLRIGTMDLRIAAIALANDTLLLTANSQHFKQVPGLRLENWLE